MKYSSPSYQSEFFGIYVQHPEIDQYVEALREFGSSLVAKHLGAALRKSAQPAITSLRSTTPKGPTGNLRRAITSKVVVYPQSGNAVLLVGYRKAGSTGIPTKGKVQKGNDRAYHAGLLEFGTKNRTVKTTGISQYKRKPFQRKLKGGKVVSVSGGRVTTGKGAIASSFNTLGAFRLKGKGGRVKTQPGWPKAFFMRSASGQTPDLGKVRAQKPIATALGIAEGQMKTLLASNLGETVAKAKKEFLYRIGQGG